MTSTTDPYALVQKARKLGCDFAPGATFEEEQRQATKFLSRLEDTQGERAAAVVARELLNWVPSKDRETWTHPDASQYEIVCVGRVEEGPLKGLRKWRGRYTPAPDAPRAAYLGDAPTLSLDVAFLLVEDHRWLAGGFAVESTYRVMVAGLPGTDDIELGQVTAASPRDAEHVARTNGLVESADIAFYVEDAGE